jgi:20S proteasome alpha/beta subunit
VPVEEFGVQKLVRLTDTAVLGYAGNVRVGLEVMEGIEYEVKKNRALQYEEIPFEVIMFPFRNALEHEYTHRYSDKERADGLELMILSVRRSARSTLR